MWLATRNWLPSLKFAVLISFGVSVVMVTNVLLLSRQYLIRSTSHDYTAADGVDDADDAPVKGLDGLGQMDYELEEYGRPRSYKNRDTFCAAHRHQNLTSAMFNTFLYNDKYKVVYCSVPKVACTNWAKVFLVLSGQTKTSEPTDIKSYDVHSKFKKNLTTLHSLSVDEIKYRLDNYYKFVFIRNPFERLLSAYLNKFKHKNPYFHSRYGKKIIARFRPPSSNRKLSKSPGSDVTFLEFLQYVTDYTRKEVLNGHWQKMVQFCHPCLVKYDFVGSMDTMEEQADRILDKIGSSVRFPKRSQGYKHPKTNSLLRDYYKDIPTAVLDQIVEVYYPDFLMFNMTIPQSLKNINKWKIKT